MSPNEDAKKESTINKKILWTSIIVCILILGLIASNVFLWQKISSQQSSITSINKELSNQSPDLSSEVTSLQSKYNDLEGSVSDANSQIQDVIDCVNAYMKVVGNSAGEAYQYRFC
jgi:uncharacterized protein YlxW (UPF0749 family)